MQLLENPLSLSKDLFFLFGSSKDPLTFPKNLPKLRSVLYNRKLSVLYRVDFPQKAATQRATYSQLSAVGPLRLKNEENMMACLSSMPHAKTTAITHLGQQNVKPFQMAQILPSEQAAPSTAVPAEWDSMQPATDRPAFQLCDNHCDSEAHRWWHKVASITGACLSARDSVVLFVANTWCRRMIGARNKSGHPRLASIGALREGKRRFRGWERETRNSMQSHTWASKYLNHIPDITRHWRVYHVDCFLIDQCSSLNRLHLPSPWGLL